ncbi:serine threonine protein kinase CMGC group [Diaporthe eres]
MPASKARPANGSPDSRKRRRQSPVDWNKFYGGQPPKEIIVIDDSPGPDGAAVSAVPASQTLTNGNAAYNYANGVNGGPVTANTSAARHAPKRRKRDDDAPTGSGTRYDPVHHSRLNGSTTTPHQNGATPSASTISSSDRTNSAIHTTAATSLGSLSSNSQYDHDVQPGSKRKRTRQQVANEVKRRENAIIGHAYPSYHPPPQPPKKAADVHVRVIPDSYKSGTVDDSDGHYIVVPDAELTDNYQMIKMLGQGTFGKVVQARDRRRNELVAIKIIRSVQKYRDASRIELRVLATLKANDAENRNRCIHLRDCFDYRGHICIVMDLLGQSVFDFLKGNQFVPFPNSQIQSFARQLLTSVAFSRNATQRRVLLDTEIRLIDFGSATFQDEYHSSVVSTRHYRAPEIILGLGWSFPCDIWSIGCILVEFFTGDALFQTHENLEHLAMMENVVGSRIDSHLVTQVNKMTRNGGNPASKYFKRGRLDYPIAETTRASRRFVKAMKKLDDIIPNNTPFLKNFRDLLKKIFVYDPAHRITAKQALQHPWFKETAHPDDGTEAAKIKMERLRASQGLSSARSVHG